MKDRGETRKLPQLVIRGNLILYTIMPSKMKHSPLLMKVQEVLQERKEHFSEKKQERRLEVEHLDYRSPST